MLLATHAESIPPNITCPSNVTRDMPAGQITVAVALGTPTTSDNCGNDQVVVTNNSPYAPNIDPRFSVGSSTIRWTATDSAGNSANCSQTITVLNQGRSRQMYSACLGVGVVPSKAAFVLQIELKSCCRGISRLQLTHCIHI